MSTKIRHNRIHSWHGESLRQSLKRDPTVLPKKPASRLVEEEETRQVRASNRRTRTVRVGHRYAQSEIDLSALPDGDSSKVSGERCEDAQDGQSQGLPRSDSA